MSIKQYLEKFLGILGDIVLLPVRGNIFPQHRDVLNDWNGPEVRAKRKIRLAHHKGE